MVAARKRLLLCYSQHNEDVIRRLLVHLDRLVSDHDVEVWRDRSTKPGELWHERIQQRLAGCDAVLTATSPGLLATEYVQQHELPVIARRL